MGQGLDILLEASLNGWRNFTLCFVANRQRIIDKLMGCQDQFSMNAQDSPPAQFGILDEYWNACFIASRAYQIGDVGLGAYLDERASSNRWDSYSGDNSRR